MISFFHHVKVRIVQQQEVAEFDPSGRSFFNVNTPEDLTEAEGFLAKARGQELDADARAGAR